MASISFNPLFIEAFIRTKTWPEFVVAHTDIKFQSSLHRGVYSDANGYVFRKRALKISILSSSRRLFGHPFVLQKIFPTSVGKCSQCGATPPNNFTFP